MKDENINMTLDDIIKNKIKEDKSGKYRQMSMGKKARKMLRHQDPRRRLKVENLDEKIENAELTKMFGEYGSLKRCGVIYNKLGKSIGKADIEYTTHEECQKAIENLNNKEIQGKKIIVRYTSKVGWGIRRRPVSAGVRRRDLRRVNRYSIRKRMVRSTTRGLRRRPLRRVMRLRKRSGTGPRRMVFRKTLGRRHPLRKRN